ncbi:IclR family transcriptional regulator domain-containing protein [Pararhizobium haloflavum]|uniref:IclR family transcriptional regulator domain-containing protein n=1 Tax=Pararhizobium haloflavum TaxID=2037914 RepID=UPI000C190CAF|nr:IclR family transcriptional regulator C-terminal domain-containing protein [Pararhizobium haloflavum]
MEKSGDFVEGLAKGLSVLEVFDRARPEMTLSEVARATGMSPAAARRSLHTLVTLGYMRQVQRKFVLSARVLKLAASYLDAANIEELLLPELRRLVGSFGDAASVAVLEGDDVLYVAHYSEQRASRMIASVGTVYPAYATSLGKVLLASLSREALAAYLDRVVLRPLTDRTICDNALLRETVDTARTDGFATARDELDYGITSLSVPVRDRLGRTVAAINSSGYTGRLTIDEIVARRLDGLRTAAARIGRTLDSYPPLLNSFFNPSISER